MQPLLVLNELSPYVDLNPACVCVVLFLQTVIVTLLVQSMIAVMTEDFVSVRREHQGLNVINVCRDISGTAWAVNVSNSELPLSCSFAASASVCYHVQLPKGRKWAKPLQAVRMPYCQSLWRFPDEDSRLTVPSINFNVLSVSSLLLLITPAGAPTEIHKYACLPTCEVAFVY